MSEHNGKEENAETLKSSAANVAVYTAGGFTEFQVGEDGFLKVYRRAHPCVDARRSAVAVRACGSLRKRVCTPSWFMALLTVHNTQGNNWYVFTLDGNGKIQPCNEDTCGHD